MTTLNKWIATPFTNIILVFFNWEKLYEKYKYKQLTSNEIYIIALNIYSYHKLQ